MTTETALQEISREVSVCVKCPLHATRTRAVPGDGPSDAGVMIVGEGPRRNEDEQGLPFVGAAGKNLDGLLSMAGLERNSVFITNCVKCRPPGNRRPSRKELDACHPYLRRQTEALAPRVVVLLGDTALKEFFPERSLGTANGNAIRRGEVEYFPTYHPAAVIYNPSLREALESDFAKLGELLSETPPD
jgi:uracil-DNA glycosylase